MNLFFAVIQQTLQFLGLTIDPSSSPGWRWYNITIGKFRVNEAGTVKNEGCKTLQSIVSAAGNTVLSVASPEITVITGTLAQTVTLPNATISTMWAGWATHISNQSTGPITIKTADGTTLFIMAGLTDIDLECVTIGTVAGTWDLNYLGINVASGNRLDVNNSIGLSGTDGVVYNLASMGGGLTQYSGLANLDFGNEDTNAIVTIANGVITNANLKAFSFIPQETASTFYDDFYLNDVSFFIKNIIDNVSFDIVGSASNGASGIYQIKYILNY